MTYTTNSPKTRKHVPAGTAAVITASMRNVPAFKGAEHTPTLKLAAKYYGTDSREVILRVMMGQLDTIA
jgi:hypothetical protein